MKLLINLYNQTAAGPKNISLNLISELMSRTNNDYKFYIIVPDILEYTELYSTANVQFIKLRKVNSIASKIAVRIYLDIILIPILIRKYQINSMLAFGNFLLSPVKVRKVVLLHHPYLFDNALLQKLPLYSKLIERIKRFTFWMTLKNVDVVVVQSSYVFDEFKKVWANAKVKLSIISNPISKDFTLQSTLQIQALINQRESSLKNNLKILYVSRFYPHKNHKFLLALSSKLADLNIKHQIFVTVDEEITGADVFFNDVTRSKLSIINIGEIKQADLIEFYKTSHLFLFPSKSETFGNPLIEAMSYGLPVIVPSLQYAYSVVGESGIYYQEDNASECAIIINELIQNTRQFLAKSLQSHQSFTRYTNVTDWSNSYLALFYTSNI